MGVACARDRSSRDGAARLACGLDFPSPGALLRCQERSAGSTRKCVSAALLEKPDASDTIPFADPSVWGEGHPSNLTCVFPAGSTADPTAQPRLGVPGKGTVILLLQINSR